jgi:hypothetical protein
MAFRGASLLDQSEVIVVAVTNAQMYVDAMAMHYDRRRAIERRIKDSDTPVVYFEFRPNGNYRGYSFYFASGNGCGYCGRSLGVTSTVKLANGKLMGSLKGGDTGRTFDVTLDIPVGFSNGKEAVLLISGESGTSRLTGEVLLLNQGGTWRVDDELTDVVMK